MCWCGCCSLTRSLCCLPLAARAARRCCPFAARQTDSNDTRARACNATRPQMRGGNTTGTRATPWIETQEQADGSGSGCGCGAGHVVIAAALRPRCMRLPSRLRAHISNRMEQRASCDTLEMRPCGRLHCATSRMQATRPSLCGLALAAARARGAPRCRLPFFVRRGDSCLSAQLNECDGNVAIVERLLQSVAPATDPSLPFAVSLSLHR